MHLLLTLEVLLAQGDPDSPYEGVASAEQGDLDAPANEEVPIK